MSARDSEGADARATAADDAAGTAAAAADAAPDPAADPAADPAVQRQAATRGADLVRATLARYKEDARSRAAADARSTRGARRRQAAAEAPQREAGDPVAFGSAVREMLDQRGWNAEAAAARVLADWPRIVGPEVAAASRPVRLRAGELLLEAESTAWATQLRLLSRSILTRISAELGPDVVRRLVVRGPTGPDWRHGRLRVPGPGPRDTYG